MKAGGPYDMQLKASNIMTIQKHPDRRCVGSAPEQSNRKLSMERLKDKYPAVIAAALIPTSGNLTSVPRWNGNSLRVD